jgi:DNA ligase 4
LIVIGGYFGSQRRITSGVTKSYIDNVSGFLCGILHGTINKLNPKTCTVIPFVKVGTGYSQQELQVMKEKLKPVMNLYDSRMPPAWMKSWNPQQQDRPDVCISDLSKSIVLEIKASELQRTI